MPPCSAYPYNASISIATLLRMAAEHTVHTHSSANRAGLILYVTLLCNPPWSNKSKKLLKSKLSAVYFLCRNISIPKHSIAETKFDRNASIHNNPSVQTTFPLFLRIKHLGQQEECIQPVNGNTKIFHTTPNE